MNVEKAPKFFFIYENIKHHINGFIKVLVFPTIRPRRNNLICRLSLLKVFFVFGICYFLWQMCFFGFFFFFADLCQKYM